MHGGAVLALAEVMPEAQLGDPVVSRNSPGSGHVGRPVLLHMGGGWRNESFGVGDALNGVTTSVTHRDSREVCVGVFRVSARALMGACTSLRDSL